MNAAPFHTALRILAPILYGMRLPRLATTLLLSLVALLASCGAGGVSPQQRTLAEQALVHLNAARVAGATCGGTNRPPVGRVALNDLLIEAAQAHSNDMLEMRNLTHTGSDGSNPGQRIARTGYQAATWGENAASGYRDEPAVVAGWLRSTPHCNSIMNGNYTEIGVARADNYWTLVFARPRQQ